MNVIGLASGKKFEISDMQFERIMRRNDLLRHGSFIPLYHIEDPKVVIGKVNVNAIEFIANDDALFHVKPQRGRPPSA